MTINEKDQDKLISIYCPAELTWKRSQGKFQVFLDDKQIGPEMIYKELLVFFVGWEKGKEYWQNNKPVSNKC